MNNKRFFTTLLTLLFASTLVAQTIRLEEIIKGEEFVGFSPQNIQWAADGKSVVFDWNPDHEFGRSLYAYQLDQKKMVKVPIENGFIQWTPTLSDQIQSSDFHYYNNEGSLCRYHFKTKTKTVIYSTNESVNEIFYLPSKSAVYFTVQQNVFCYQEKIGSITQLTNFIQGNEEVQKKDTSFLYKQQRELFSFILLQDRQKDWAEKQAQRKIPIGIYFAKNESIRNLNISADGRYITFVLAMDAEEQLTNYQAHITSDGYVQNRIARSKVTNKEPNTRFGIFDIERDTVYYINASKLTDIRKKPAYLSEYGSTGNYTTDRDLSFHTAIMHESEGKALIDIRSYDNKDRWICLVNFETGDLKELVHQHDEAWIGGPGISEWNDAEGTLSWLNATDFIFQSEESGYSHLYRMNCQTLSKKALTAGNWEVQEVILSRDKKTIYFLANKIHPGVRNGYKLTLSNNQITPLFEGNFGIEWTLSPDEKNWAIRYSTATKPWELCVVANLPEQKLVPITKSTFPEFDKLPLQSPEIIQIPSSDGKLIYSRIYKPKEQSNGAAVLFVHGAGYLQNAHYYWSYYQREMLFHQLLISKGYTVLDVDYRASEGYGRDWRTDIYRDMGNRDLNDFVDAKAFLVSQLKIDSTKVGIYGGSYGGFITLMGLLKTPTTFACGAALRSVTDWAHYNHEYTSNILNNPSTDPKAFKRSSPIYFAENLERPLLMLHGMVDDNVQFQDIVRLNQRFIELGKTHFQLSIYPTEAHGFTFTPAWIDEYRRILELFETNLN
jgi:dipeptidyl aminopeptidase/acylaminoacyl peptidase